MKFFTVFLLILTFCFSCRNSGEGPEYILRLGHQANEQDIWHRSALHFAHVLDSLSEGRIEVRVHPAEQLGVELDMIRSIRAGIVEMTITGESMQNWAGITALLAVPYLIRDSEHLKQVVEGEIGQEIATEMIREIGVRPIGYFERGPRHLTSNRPITQPEDLAGIILRVPNVPLFVQVWQALGAKPTPMTFSEVFTALQQGTVEAQENPFALIYSAGLFEVQKYLNLTRHVTSWIYVVIGEKQFQSLPEDLQKKVLEAGKQMQQYHEREFVKQEELLRHQLEDKGMQFIEPDVEAFRKKAEAAVLEALPEAYGALYKKITELGIENETDESDL
ncbi:TRAP transporter substrate-binding protein [Mariniphaga sp.]|uniref:TRAP transporter substrate-binding protein n=1 Tax=Mariniphaga sp. TaxID=1954475 RepID=UPI0035670157